MQAVTIGLDIAKSLFQIHAVDGRGNVIIRRQLKRRQVLPFFSVSAPSPSLEAAQTSFEVRGVSVPVETPYFFGRADLARAAVT